jgi:hypothetical protein
MPLYVTLSQVRRQKNEQRDAVLSSLATRQLPVEQLALFRRSGGLGQRETKRQRLEMESLRKKFGVPSQAAVGDNEAGGSSGRPTQHSRRGDSDSDSDNGSGIDGDSSGSDEGTVDARPPAVTTTAPVPFRAIQRPAPVPLSYAARPTGAHSSDSGSDDSGDEERDDAGKDGLEKQKQLLVCLHCCTCRV